MKQEMTEQEAYLQLAALCARAEHCQQEMRDKMRRWGLDEQVQERVVARLVKERFVDDERYARAFVKDKVHYNKWGRRKVQQGLWMKRIDEDIQRRVKQKRKSTKAASDYELNQKLVRFALGRGFTFDIIRQCLDVDEEMDDGDETD